MHRVPNKMKNELVIWGVKEISGTKTIAVIHWPGPLDKNADRPLSYLIRYCQ